MVNSRQKTILLNIVASPFFLAIPLALAIIFFLPEIFQKYKADLLENGPADKANAHQIHADLDGDGNSEMLVAFPNIKGMAAMKVYDQHNMLIDQWNLPCPYPARGDRFFYSDIDNNGFSEVFIITQHDDSLFLNALDPMSSSKFLFTNKLITTINKRNGSIDFALDFIAAEDMNKDGTKELVMNISAGFSLQPRGVFIFNPVSGTIYRSPLSGASTSCCIIADLDQDQLQEVYLSAQTLGNIHDSLHIPFDDYSSWVFGFDHQLNFLFNPIEFPYYPSSCNIIPFGPDKIMALQSSRSQNYDSAKLFVMNKSGIIEQMNCFYLSPKDRANGLSIFEVKTPDGTSQYIAGGEKGIQSIDENLFIGKGRQFDYFANGYAPLDVDSDGFPEYFSNSNEDMKALLILRHDFTCPVPLDISLNQYATHIAPRFSFKTRIGHKPQLFIHYENTYWIYDYGFNYLYYLRYPAYAGVYLVVLLVLLVIQKLMKLQLERKAAIANRFNSLQLKTIKSQLEPHFMFNALNSISLNLLRERPELTYDYMLKFSKLLRSLFANTDQLTVTLKEELEFVENYLEIERLRFGKELNYEINIAEKVDTDANLPRMLLQLITENAVKHGLRKKKGEGLLKIAVGKLEDKILVNIEDNGVGREAAAQYPDGHGKGTHIIEEMLSLFYKVKNVKIEYRYIDLYDDSGAASGTRVEVVIPAAK